jgi:hypothetical protein
LLSHLALARQFVRCYQRRTSAIRSKCTEK